MTTSTYTVVGMTCGHCVDAVTEEVGAVPGVTAVDVDLASGGLTVTSTEPVDDVAVACDPRELLLVEVLEEDLADEVRRERDQLAELIATYRHLLDRRRG